MSASVNNLAFGPNLAAQSIQSTTTGLLSTRSKGSDLSSKATEFEAILLGQWLQGCETAFGSVPGGEEDEDAGADQMKSFAFQHLASGLAEKGGIGIAKMVQMALARDANGAPSPGSHLAPASYQHSSTAPQLPAAVQRTVGVQQATSPNATIGYGINVSKSFDPEEGQ